MGNICMTQDAIDKYNKINEFSYDELLAYKLDNKKLLYQSVKLYVNDTLVNGYGEFYIIRHTEKTEHRFIYTDLVGLVHNERIHVRDLISVIQAELDVQRKSYVVYNRLLGNDDYYLCVNVNRLNATY